MATLEELRAQLDGIDNEIIELYKKRMDVCMEIGDIKISAGNKVFDKQREREKLVAVAAKVTEEFHKKGVQELFEQLMSLPIVFMCRLFEMRWRQSKRDRPTLRYFRLRTLLRVQSMRCMICLWNLKIIS